MSTPHDHRNALLAIAYRMLGNRADAEDAVQEAYLRYDQLDATSIREPNAYLTTLVTRRCIDQLRSAHTRRNRPAGLSLPEPLDTAGPDADHHAGLADTLSVAFLVLLQQLSPTERAVFLLREAFDYSYAEIAETVGKSTANCRQLHTRAKRHLAAGRTRFSADRAAHEALVDRFAHTCSGGDVRGLLELLAPDASLHADGGPDRPAYGRARAIAGPIRGADAVARFAIAVEQQAPDQGSFRRHNINGQPALLRYVVGELVAVVSFAFADGRIHAIFVNADPAKLTGLGTLRRLH